MYSTSRSLRQRDRYKEALARNPHAFGIDRVEVKLPPLDGGTWLLKLHLIAPAGGVTRKVGRAITASMIRIKPLVFTAPLLEVLSVEYAPHEENVPAIRVRLVRQDAGIEDPADYRLTLGDAVGLHPQFASADFSLSERTPMDPRVVPAAPDAGDPGVHIDYLAKDYASFRQLMLDNLAALSPEWTERHAADLGITIVEVLAYVADYLSYYQDAVSTEAYLGTARRRASLRRHARLLSHSVSEGATLRVWVSFEVQGTVCLPRGAALLSQLPLANPCVPRLVLDQMLQHTQVDYRVFETMHEASLIQDHNHFDIHTWELPEFRLETGCVRAALEGSHARLKAGDVLIFEEVAGELGGTSADANPAHRHAVRLSKDPRVIEVPDAGTASSRPVTEIEWYDEDAFPFALTVAAFTNAGPRKKLAVVRGNVVLADEGKTVCELLPAVTSGSVYRPQVPVPGILWAAAYDDAAARRASATATLQPDPAAALPAASVYQYSSAVTRKEIAGKAPAGEWLPASDLLLSGRFARRVVVEREDEGLAYFRFSNNTHGRKPFSTPADQIAGKGTNMAAVFRVGQGLTLNPEVIKHVVVENVGEAAIRSIRNPLPSGGGADPEPNEEIRFLAPIDYWTQRRLVVPEDYFLFATRHPGVRNAVARLLWTGSRTHAVLWVQCNNGQPLDAETRTELEALLEPGRLAGITFEVVDPNYVPLDIALKVRVQEGNSRAEVSARLRAALGNQAGSNGEGGFFAPDHFTFGQPVYLSAILSAALGVRGVDDVVVSRFQRLGARPAHELHLGVLTTGETEIARMDDDPAAPGNGRLSLTLTGAEG